MNEILIIFPNVIMKGRDKENVNVSNKTEYSNQ